MKYEGVLLPYDEKGLLPARGVDIDIPVTQRHSAEFGLFIQGQLVPVVYLRVGGILIPAAKFEAGKQQLDSASHTP